MKADKKEPAPTAQLKWSAPPADIGGHGSIHDTDDAEYGWNPATIKMRPEQSNDDWVDEEVALDSTPRWGRPEEFHDAGVSVIVNRRTKTLDASWLILAAILGLCLVVLGSHLQKPDGIEENNSRQTTAAEEARTWLSSAEESLAQQDHDLAVAQLEKGLSLLVEARAEQSQIVETRLRLATALEQNGQFQASHKQWSGLVDSDPKAKKRIAELEKKLRVEANELLQRSTAERKAGRLKIARSLADEAFGLYQAYGGSPGQKADSLEAAARANLADNRLVAAESNLQQAQKYAWSQERASLLSSIAPRPQARTSAAYRQPSVGRPSTVSQRRPSNGYPQAPYKAPIRAKASLQTVHQPPSTPAPPVAPPQPVVKYQPPPDSPAYSSADTDNEHLGDEGVLESYRSSGPRTGGGPGYR